MDPARDSIGRWIGGAVFLLTTGLCVALAAPAGHWLDSAEFAAASFELGNAHPPGHPLAIAVGKAATLLPLGGIAFRVNCASGVALGVAAVLLLYTIRRVIQQAWAQHLPAEAPLRGGITWTVATAGSMGFVLGYAALHQGVRAEVYALNLALNLAVLHLVVRYLVTPRTRDLVAAGLVAGLGLCNHHLLTLAVLPAGLAAVAWRRGLSWRTRLRQVGYAAAAAALGLAVLAQLPVRSAQTPVINWGTPHRAEGFAWTVSAKLFSRTAERSLRRRPANRVAALARTTHAELSPGILLAGLGGLLLLAWRRRLRPLAVLLAGALALNAGAAVLAGFEPDNPDSLGYVLLLFALLCGLAAVAAALVLGRLGRSPRWRVGAPVLAGLLLVWPLASAAAALGRVDLRQAYGAEETAEVLLDASPPAGLLLTSYYQTGFGVWAARILRGARPDVDHVHRSYLSQPGYVTNLLARNPRLRGLLGGLRRPGALDHGRLAPEAARRTVLFEFDDDTFGPGLIRHSAPHGPLCRVLPPGARPPPRAPAHRRRSARLWRRLTERLQTTAPDPLTRLYLLWARYLRARYHVRRRDCAAARRSWERARALGNPRDPALVAIARRCGF